jgi:hypothetical protein
VVKALGVGAAVQIEGWSSAPLPELPEPLASTRQYVPTEDGGTRRVRGYLTADIRAAVDRAATSDIGSDSATDTD